MLCATARGQVGLGSCYHLWKAWSSEAPMENLNSMAAENVPHPFINIASYIVFSKLSSVSCPSPYSFLYPALPSPILTGPLCSIVQQPSSYFLWFYLPSFEALHQSTITPNPFHLHSQYSPLLISRRLWVFQLKRIHI